MRRFSIHPKDIEFVMRTLVYSLLLLAILHAFKPYLADSEAAPNRQAVERLAGQVRMITPAEIRGYLEQAHKPTMLVIYASWCPYCKKVMPSIFELWNERKIAGDHMLLLSVDQQISPLAAYLLTNRFDTMVGAPFVLSQNPNMTLSKMLQSKGAGFDGGIPYIAIFDINGKFVDELRGGVEKNEIQDLLVKLQ